MRLQLTTGGHPYPFRITCRFQKKDVYIVLEQIRTVDGQRFIKRLGRVPQATLAIREERERDPNVGSA